MQVVLDGDALNYSPGVVEMARALDVDPLRLALGWGDWQLVATCGPHDLEVLSQIASRTRTELHRLGRVEDGVGVQLEVAGSRGHLLPLDSQRFAPDSWFSAGLDAYTDVLLHGPLQHPVADI